MGAFTPNLFGSVKMDPGAFFLIVQFAGLLV